MTRRSPGGPVGWTLLALAVLAALAGPVACRALAGLPLGGEVMEAQP